MKKMRVLLDTNIIIHRENDQVTNYSIGHLFYWLDKLECEKVIHPLSIREIERYNDQKIQELYRIKLSAYNQLTVHEEISDTVLSAFKDTDKSENDRIDTALLNTVFLKHVDLFITEDKKLRQKAEKIGLKDKVYSINRFITSASERNPRLIEYKALSVKQTHFGELDINNPFFDTFKKDYPGFEDWFARKCDEEAYICNDDRNNILGFLYLKTEEENESYPHMRPVFLPKRRLKVGTFKVESTGFRLGERFIKIIFDNALKRNVDEIYVTLFEDRPELGALQELFERWGFKRYGVNLSTGKEEAVFVKTLNVYDSSLSPKKNFPNIQYNVGKFIMPIEACWHTDLIPDSQLRTENLVNFLGKDACKYALQKVYVSWARDINGAKPGDLVFFYRMGETEGRKGFESVISTVCVIDEIKRDFKSENELLRYCQNRSVFSESDLKSFWQKKSKNLSVIKFILIKSLEKRPILNQLRDLKIIPPREGPRPFTRITDAQYEKILQLAQTSIKYV
ncbi:putative uncharacterized protein [Acetobacter sp. CAG:977]|nr:putative uncharacterized protein [Acetobacter sp. CAG:977]